jgi:hypothetical protein
MHTTQEQLDELNATIRHLGLILSHSEAQRRRAALR